MATATLIFTDLNNGQVNLILSTDSPITMTPAQQAAQYAAQANVLGANVIQSYVSLKPLVIVDGSTSIVAAKLG